MSDTKGAILGEIPSDTSQTITGLPHWGIIGILAKLVRAWCHQDPNCPKSNSTFRAMTFVRSAGSHIRMPSAKSRKTLLDIDCKWCVKKTSQNDIPVCSIFTYGYGSIPIDTFLVGWTSIYQLFWGSLGTRVLTHPHIIIRYLQPLYPAEYHRIPRSWHHSISFQQPLQHRGILWNDQGKHRGIARSSEDGIHGLRGTMGA